MLKRAGALLGHGIRGSSFRGARVGGDEPRRGSEGTPDHRGGRHDLGLQGLRTGPLRFHLVFTTVCRIQRRAAHSSAQLGGRRRGGAPDARDPRLPPPALVGPREPAVRASQDTTYCVWGFLYRKPTRIWSNLPWEPSKPMCTKRTPCPHLQDGKHPEAAQRGPNSTHKVSHSRDQLYSLPPALCNEIAAAATAAMQ